MESSIEHSLRHAVSTLCVETRLAEDRASAFLDWARLERDLALCSALAANGVVHLAVASALRLAGVAAVLAALGSAQVSGRVELLLTVGEHESLTALAAL